MVRSVPMYQNLMKGLDHFHDIFFSGVHVEESERGGVAQVALQNDSTVTL